MLNRTTLHLHLFYHKILKNLQNLEMFKDSISTATPKYVTINGDNEKLPYQQMEFGRAKSAM